MTLRRLLGLIVAVGIFAAWQGRESFLAHPIERAPAAGDSLLNAWILLCDYHALTTDGVAIWNAPNFHPTPNALAFSENLFGLLWLSLPVQYFTGNPVLAVNVVVLVAFLLNAHAAYLLSRTAGAGYFPAIFGGLILAFAPYLWSHLPHVQLLSLYPGIYAWNFALRFLQQHRSVHLLLATAFLVWAFYCSIYLGLIFLIAIGIFFLSQLGLDPAVRPLLRQWKFWASTAACAMLLGLALWPLSRPYLEAAHAWDAERTVADCARYSCELGSFLLPPHMARVNHAWLAHLLPPGIRDGEAAVFPGLAPLILFAAGGAGLFFAGGKSPRPLLKSLLLTSGLLMVLMLGPIWIWRGQETGFYLPFVLLQKLPGLGAIRVPARFILPLLVCLAVTGALLLTAWQQRIRNPWLRRGFGALAFLCLVLDYRLRPDPGANALALLEPTPLDAFLLRQPADTAVLYWPFKIESPRMAGFQLEQAKHWRPLVNGTSGVFPATFVDLNRRLSGPRDEIWSRDLHDSPADVFVVNRSALRPDHDPVELVERIRAAGFRPEGALGEFDVYSRADPPPTRAAALSVRAVEVIVGATPADDVAWAALEAPAGTCWYAASGIVRRGILHTENSGAGPTRSLELRVPTMLAADQIGGGRLRANYPLRQATTLPQIEIDGRSWGQSIPVRRIPLGDTSAEPSTPRAATRKLSLVSPNLNLPVPGGQPMRVTLEVQNIGPTTWLNHAMAAQLRPRRGDVDVSFMWVAPGPSASASVALESAAAIGTLELDQPVHPGESARLSGVIPVPSKPGRYNLRIELLCQSVGWLSEHGPSAGLAMEVAVE